jgi:PAS domain S-box-containing protein
MRMNSDRVLHAADEMGQDEEILGQSESMLGAIIDFLPDATFVIDRNRKVIAWNRAMEKMTGVLASEMLGKGDYEYAHPFYQKKRPILIDLAFSQDTKIEQQYSWVKREGTTYMAETTMPRPQGRGTVLWGIASPFYDDAGEVIGAIESIRDITEWREAELRLRESEERYRTVFENSGTAMAIVDEDGTITLVNAESEKLSGYAREEMLGRMRWDSMIAPHDRDRVQRMCMVRSRKPDSAVRHFEADLVDRWGKTKRGLFTVSLIRGMKNRVVSIIDITDRKRAGERIDHLNRVLLALRNVNELIIREKDRDRLLHGICTTLVETRGYFGIWIALLDTSENCVAAAEAGLGDAFLPMRERLNHGDLTKCTRRALDRSGVVAIEEPGKDCSDSPLAATYEALGLMIVRLEHAGKVYGILAATTPREVVVDHEEQGLYQELANDIAFALHSFELEEESHYRDALAKANKKLNLLGKVTRHDILNLLNPLFGYTDLLEAATAENEVQARYVSGIRDAAERVKRQISFTRDYEDLGVKAPEWQRVERVAGLAAESVPMEEVTLEAATGPLEVFADPLLEKVFINLLENAVRHGERVTTVRVSFVERGDKGVIVIEDDGVGVPAAHKQQIFDRRFGKNTGLGLFLAKEILSITRITIRETGETGKGARFEITVPARGYRMASE